MTVAVFKDRVRETTTTTGTGTISLAGAVTGYQSFSVLGNLISCYYLIALQAGADWEVGLGTYTSAGSTLSRDTILASSNSGSAVNFGVGTKDVFLDIPASVITATPTANLIPRADATGTLDKGWLPALNGLTAADVGLTDAVVEYNAAASANRTITAQRLLGYGSHALCQGRLTLTSGTAVTTSDVTGATTMYWTPYRGNRVGLFDGTRWKLETFSELSLSLGTLNPTPFQLVDIYAYDNSGTPALDYALWTQTTKTINAFDGTSKFTTTAAHGYSVGDVIGITSITGTVGTNATSGANGRLWVILTVPTTTTFTCEGTNWSGLTYTSGGTTYQVSGQTSPGTTTQDTILVKSGDVTRRVLGTMGAYGGGQTNTPTQATEDSKLRRLVWNLYNQRRRKILMQSAVANWTSATTSWRLANLNPANRLEVVIGQSDSWLTARVSGYNTAGASIAGAVGIGVDSTTVISADLYNDAGGGPSQGILSAAFYDGPLSAGYRMVNWLEYSRVGTVTWYGNGLAEQQSGISGYVVA